MKLVVIDEQLAGTPPIAESELLTGLCTALFRLYPAAQPPLPWAGYLAEEEGAYVGTCAFKSVPAEGKVEIAYFTFPGHEGRGVATRMAQRLVALATRPEVTQVSAQTLPEKNASTRILEKLGFRFVGPVMHPEDGEVWEWHLR